MPGLTAYASAIKLADVQAGQNVLVSAAAGPVGCMVGQLAIQRGARAWGIAGGSEKCALVTQEFGFSACVDYHTAGYAEQLSAAVPDGFDMYHDNVGGAMLTTALGLLRPYGIVILCGLISQYNDSQKGAGFNIGPAILKRAVMKGLVVYDFENERQAFLDMAAPLVKSGQIRYREDFAFGIEATGAHFSKLMSGKNVGKALVAFGDE
jgi:NADPH-dependent curcumin reductase CurA